jgi:hypothetical protein
LHIINSGFSFLIDLISEAPIPEEPPVITTIAVPSKSSEGVGIFLFK